MMFTAPMDFVYTCDITKWT